MAASSSTSPSSQLIFQRAAEASVSITPTRFQLKTTLPRFHLQASRRPPNFRQNGDTSAVDPRNQSRNMSFMGDYDDDDDDDDDEDDESDRSLDVLIQFVENVYKKSDISI